MTSFLRQRDLPVMSRAGLDSRDRAADPGYMRDSEVRCDPPRLYVGNIDESFRQDCDLTLGPWCFIGHERDSRAAETQSYPYILKSGEDLYGAGKTAQKLARSIADGLVDDLNLRHGTAYSVRYWRYMTVPWLIHLVQVSISYHEYIEKFVAEYRHRDLQCMIPADTFSVKFPDTQAFIDLGVREPAFGTWVSSLILRELAPANWTLDPSLEIETAVNKTRAGVIAPREHSLMSSGFRWVFPRLRVDQVAGTKLSRLLLHLWLAILPVPRRNRRKNHPAKTNAAVPKPTEIEVPETLLRVIDQLVSKTRPETLDGGYAALDAAASATRYKPGRLMVGSMPLYDDRQRIVTARAEEAGEIIIPVQHGGNYGLCKIHPDVFELEYGRGRFLTWGWNEHETEQDDCKFYPVPAPGLSNIRNVHQERDGALVFTGCRITSVPWRLCAIPRAAQWVDYRQDKISFLDALDDAALSNLVYRPYIKDEEDLSDSRYVQSRFPDVPILSGVLEPTILSCRLFVLDYPGSTLNYAMAANVPTVCFWGPDAWPESTQGEALLNWFRALGILHDTPVSAALHINIIWGDIDTWWHSDDVQAARREFCHHYARTSRIWWWRWLKTLTRIHFER